MVMVFCIMPLLSRKHEIALLQPSFAKAEKNVLCVCAHAHLYEHMRGMSIGEKVRRKQIHQFHQF